MSKYLHVFTSSGLLFIMILFCASAPAEAQMVTGSNMRNFAAVFGLGERESAKSYSIDEIGAFVGAHRTANVLWPGENISFEFRVVNKTDRPLRGRGDFHLIQYGTHGQAGDVWTPTVFKIADCGAFPFRLEIAPRAAQQMTVNPVVPGTYGGYALIADVAGEGRAFAATMVRVIRPDSGRVQFPAYALDFTWDEFMNEEVMSLFEKLGVKGARMGADYALGSLPDYAERMQKLEKYLRLAWEHQITVMLTVDNGSGPMPLGRPRPWLSPDARMLQTKDDRAWLPRYDQDFQQWITRLTSKWGWPQGPVNAIELWNEPWEGISISGWGADIPRYREIYTRMALGVEQARKNAGVKVLIGGTCSSTNARDKLFSDGTDHFLKWIDFISIHYQALSADPSIVPEWVHRQSAYGPTKVWDTESWIANSEDRFAGVIASMRAQGQSRTAGIYGGNVYDSVNRRVGDRVYPVVQAWSPAAAVAATQKFIGQRPFKQLLFKNGLPWVFVFGGLHGNDDSTLVILGNLAGCYEPQRTLFRSVKVKPDAQLTITSESHFRLYDFYGNQVRMAGTVISVPLNGLGYFLRTDETPGSFPALESAVTNGKISGYDPVELIAHDMTKPIAAKPELKISVTNVLNRPVAGTLQVQLGNLFFAESSKPLELAAHETRSIAFQVSSGEAAAGNSYPLVARFHAASGESVEHEEQMHANAIVRRTIKVDGDLRDWSGVLPETINGNGVGASLTEEAWLPFRNFTSAESANTATAYLAYDDDNFYFAAKIADPTPDEGMVRFEKRDDDSYFYPDKVWESDNEGAKKEPPLFWPSDVRHFSYRRNFDIPSGNDHDNVQIAFNVLDPAQKPFLQYPPGTEPKFMVYADTDYEFALNPVAESFGGGTEVWRLLAPGMPRKHFYPREPKSAIDGGAVKDAVLVMRREGNTRIVECSIPWTEIPEVNRRRAQGRTIKFSYRVNNDKGNALELANERSVSKYNALTFHNDWSTHWANEIEFAFEK